MPVTICTLSDIEDYMKVLYASSKETYHRMCEIIKNANPLEFLYQMKFEEIGCDPFDSTRRLNLIEQLNQTFTYAASLKAAEYLLHHHEAYPNSGNNFGGGFCSSQSAEQQETRQGH